MLVPRRVYNFTTPKGTKRKKHNEKRVSSHTAWGQRHVGSHRAHLVDVLMPQMWFFFYQTNPKNPGMSWERDYPYIPILRVGLDLYWLHLNCIKYSFSSWWLNQPIWKICSSNWKSSPNGGENKQILETTIQPFAGFNPFENCPRQISIASNDLLTSPPFGTIEPFGG